MINWTDGFFIYFCGWIVTIFFKVINYELRGLRRWKINYELRIMRHERTIFHQWHPQNILLNVLFSCIILLFIKINILIRLDIVTLRLTNNFFSSVTLSFIHNCLALDITVHDLFYMPKMLKNWHTTIGMNSISLWYYSCLEILLGRKMKNKL